MAEVPKEQALRLFTAAVQENLPAGTKVWRSGKAFADNIRDSDLPAITLLEMTDRFEHHVIGRGTTVRCKIAAYCHGMSKAQTPQLQGSNYAAARHELAYAFIQAATAAGEIALADNAGTCQVVPPFEVSYSLPGELGREANYPYFAVVVNFFLSLAYTVPGEITYTGLALELNEEELAL